MKTAVFLIQNQTTFVCPCAQPNSQPKNCPALTADSRVAKNICGSASTDAAPANRTHGRHTAHTLAHTGDSARASSSSEKSTAAPCASATHAPINIITTKLCACTSGISPATTPAANICRRAKGRRTKAKLSSPAASSPSTNASAAAARADLPFPALPLTFFFPTRRLSTSDAPSASLLPTAFCPPPAPLSLACHHSVHTTSATATPSRMLRCVTKSAVTALPHSKPG